MANRSVFPSLIRDAGRGRKWVIKPSPELNGYTGRSPVPEIVVPLHRKEALADWVLLHEQIHVAVSPASKAIAARTARDVPIQLLEAVEEYRVNRYTIRHCAAHAPELGARMRGDSNTMAHYRHYLNRTSQLEVFSLLPLSRELLMTSNDPQKDAMAASMAACVDPLLGSTPTWSNVVTAARELAKMLGKPNAPSANPPPGNDATIPDPEGAGQKAETAKAQTEEPTPAQAQAEPQPNDSAGGGGTQDGAPTSEREPLPEYLGTWEPLSLALQDYLKNYIAADALASTRYFREYGRSNPFAQAVRPKSMTRTVRSSGAPSWLPVIVRSTGPFMPRANMARGKTIRNRAAEEGAIIRNPHRYLVDGYILSKRAKADRTPVGALVVDCSGSMEWSHNRLAELILKAPHAIVICYGSDKVRNGSGILLAAHPARGIVTKEAWRDWSGTYANNFNGCDGPALEYAVSFRRAPVWWLSDGCVNGMRGIDKAPLQSHVLALCHANKILQLRSIDALDEVLAVPESAHQYEGVYDVSV